MITYWFLFPVILCATFAGLGLGVRRLSVPFSSVLLVPVGYAVAILIGAIVSYSGATKSFTGPIIFGFALVGWGFSARDIWEAARGGALREHWAWIAAGTAAFLVYGAAVILSGHASYTGYNEIVDIASQMQWAQYLHDFGRHPIGDQSFWANSNNGTPHNGYPAGPQALLALFPGTFGFNMAWSWDPYLAIMAGSIVLGAYALLRQVTESRLFAAVAAFTVGQAAPLMGYGHIGGIKEISASVPLIAAAALLPTVFSKEETPPWRAALPLTIAFSGAFAVFSLTILPWLGVIAIGAAIYIWRNISLRAALTRGAFGIGFFVIVNLVTEIPAKDSLAFAKIMENERGNLADPVSIWSSTGILITPDHRFKFAGTYYTLTVIVALIVIGLVFAGVYFAWRRRAWPPLILLVSTLVGMAVVLPREGIWVDFKAMCLTSPIMLLLAMIGLIWALREDKPKEDRRRELAWVAWAGLGLLFFVGAYSDVLRYGHTTIAPHYRLEELRHYGKQFAGVKSTLIPDWDENGGHEMDRANSEQAFNNTFPQSAEYSAQTKPAGYQYAWDVDQMFPPFVNGFSLVVQRRSPGESRPGRAFKLVEEGRYFEVWKRSLAAADATVAHVPLVGDGSDPDRVKCRTQIRSMDKAGTLTIAPSPPFTATTIFDPALSSGGLQNTADNRSVYFPGISGDAVGTVDLGTHAGKFEVYAISTSRRKTTVTVGGKTLDYQVDPSAAVRQQYLGTVEISKGGVQKVSVKVGGTSLQPGTAATFNASSYIGSVELIPAGTLRPALIHTTAGAVNCALPMDWMETP